MAGTVVILVLSPVVLGVGVLVIRRRHSIAERGVRLHEDFGLRLSRRMAVAANLLIGVAWILGGVYLAAVALRRL